MYLNSALFFIKRNILLSILLIICFFATIKILYSASSIQENHYIGLAHSLLQGRLDILNPAQYLATGDISQFKNKYFVYFGPTPAILALPLAFLMGSKVSQQSVGLTLFIFDFFLIYKIARTFRLSKTDCIWLTIFFIFGTIFFVTSLLNITAYQVQLIATSFLILTLYEFLHKRRWLLIGFWLSLAVTTRLTFGLASVFFLLEILFSSEYGRNRLKNILLFSLPILISLLIFGYYNQIRFNSYLETGYSYAINLEKDLSDTASHGTFSVEHIPGNLYFLLFKGPDPIRLNNTSYILEFPYLKASYWGMGIFFTSPLFFYILFAKRKTKNIWSLSITILLMLIPAISYFSIGIWQYGYRYAIDFYPLLFLILLSVFKNGVPFFAKVLIVYSIVFNFFFALSIWGIYPFIL